MKDFLQNILGALMIAAAIYYFFLLREIGQRAGL